MRAVVQRVIHSEVAVGGKTIGNIDHGLNVLVGFGKEDTDKDLAWMAEKIATLRVFDDDSGVMNLSVQDVGGSLLIVSQFTLFGDCRKGRRPSYFMSMEPETAAIQYEKFVALCANTGIKVASGIFQADMKVTIVNDGPVTLMLDSKKNF